MSEALDIIIKLRKRTAETQARLVSLTAELSRLRAERGRVERNGTASRRFELKARIERLATRARELENGLQADREALSEAIRKAVASPDPERDFRRLDTGFPILLLPVAIETRFSDTAQCLLIRVFPDDLHVNGHEPELTNFELECGTAFHASVAAAALEQRRRETLEEQAWIDLNEQLGPGRAAWVVRALRDLDPTSAPRRADYWTRAPHCDTLPDRWLALGYRNGQRVFTRLGNPIPDDLDVGPSPAVTEGGSSEEPAIQPGLRWLVDFDEAVRVGMALRVPYEADSRLPTEGLDHLLLLGVKSTLDPRAATHRFTGLLDAHHHTSGLALIGPNTATNNTPEAPSGFSTSPGPLSASLDREFRRPRSRVAGGTSNADRLAWAWGMSPAAAHDSLRTLDGGDGDADRDAAQMNAALWPATWGYFLTRMLQPQGDSLSDQHKARVEEARPHFVKHVRARGPFPFLRVGDQPYGLLPAIALNQWRPADKLEEGFDRDLADLLVRLREFWRESGNNGEGSTPDPLRALRLSGVTAHYRVRSVQGPEFQRNLIEILADPNRIEAGTLRQVFEKKRGLAEEVIQRLEAPLRDSVLAGCIFSEQAHRLADHSAQLPEQAAGGIAIGDYIQWLIESTYAQIRSEAPPGVDPGRLSLLQLLLRHAALAEYVDSGALVLRRVLVSNTLQSEPELVDIAEPGETTTPWRALETSLRQEGLPDQSLGSLLNDRKNRPSPLVPAKFGEFWDALGHLRHLQADELDLLMRECLDLSTHRFDAWVTSLAHKRLATLRSTPGFEEGLHLGGFGWVENLRPGRGRSRTSDGFVHAPSLSQAATATVLRAGYLNHRSGDDDSPLALNLESSRVDLALRLMEGIGAGQSLGAVLGYRFERGLHDGHPGLDLDQFLAPLRARFGPGRDLNPTATEPSGESPDAPTVDGLELHALWSQAREAAQGNRDAKARTAYMAVAEAVEGHEGGLPADPADPRAVAIQRELEILDDAIDAVSDLTLAESVHQLVNGNLERAASVTGAVSGSGQTTPEMEFVRTPRTGVTVNHRTLALFGQRPSCAAAWNPETPRARAEPCLEAWVGSLLGDATRIRADVLLQGPEGAPLLEQPSLKISVAELGLAALDFVFLAEGDVKGSCNELVDRVSFHVSRSLPADIIDAGQIKVSLERDSTWRPGDLSYQECLEPVRAIRQLLGSSRPLRPADLGLPGDMVSAEYDLDDFRQRASDSVDALELAREALHDLFDVPAGGARQRLAAWLLAPEVRHGNLLDLPNGSDLASVARNHELLDLGTVGLEQLNATRQAVRRFADFGLPWSLPVSLLGDHANDRAELLEQADFLYRESGKRLEGARRAFSLATSTEDPETRADHFAESLGSVFGPSFRAIPALHLGNEVAAELQRVFDPATHEALVEGDPDSAHHWLRQCSKVRERLRPLDECLFFAELYDAPVDPRLQVGQLPYRPATDDAETDHWVALPWRDWEHADEDRVSLVAHLPAPLENLGREGVRGLLIDEWSEVAPGPAETTGVGFHFESPAARPPQTILLAVPPAVEEEGKWSLEWLERIVLETMELAKLRTVDLDGLRGLGQFLPAVTLAFNLDGDTVSTDFAPLRSKAEEPH